ncbi:MAG: 50S ribosomal protein L3 N(5)-glutamine methyltransferase [Rhizobiaceae bacterium]
MKPSEQLRRFSQAATQAANNEASMRDNPTETFQTIRDFLRHAVSRFNEGNLVYGHGTANAYDEAAYLVLEGLNLPIDQLEPFLDARLLGPERERLAGLIEARVTTRKPLPYLLNKAYMHGVPFYVDERVIIPRSYIGELLGRTDFAGGVGALIAEPESIETVLDLCTGSGCLAVLAAMRFDNAIVDATDLSQDALDVAAINVSRHALEDRITLHKGNLYSALNGRRYDLILANPPYVAEAEVQAFAAEYAAEPRMAHVSGEDGFDLVRQIVAQAPDHLTETGILICEFGTGRELLEAEYPDLPFQFLDTEESTGEVFALSAEDFARA